jgi:hypothetical protein
MVAWVGMGGTVNGCGLLLLLLLPLENVPRTIPYLISKSTSN